MASVAENLSAVMEGIAASCLSCGRPLEEVSLMGVTKFHPRERVKEAFDAGLRLFGENRVQEAAAKYSGFSERNNVSLHLIGLLQRNKARNAAVFFDSVDAIDRVEILEELAKFAVERNAPLDVLLELHTGEDSKSGFADEDALFAAFERALALPTLRVQGLMTMAPFTNEEKPVRQSFRRLYKARESLVKRFPAQKLPCLSMGMSGDYKIAIQEGSTLLRIGTAIFGQREG